jgi:hypothetical protein
MVSFDASMTMPFTIVCAELFPKRKIARKVIKKDIRIIEKVIKLIENDFLKVPHLF